MENAEIMQAVLGLIIQLVIGLLTLYFAFSLSKTFFFKSWAVDTSNKAYMLVLSGILFSTVYLMSVASAPVLTTFKLLKLQYSGADFFMQQSRFTLVFLALAILIAFVNSFVGLKVFPMLTKTIKEKEEIEAGNLGVALLTVVVIVGLSLLSAEAMSYLFDFVIPYPARGNQFPFN